MSITRIESLARPEVGLVRLTSEPGVHGWGQIATCEPALEVRDGELAAPAGEPGWGVRSAEPWLAGSTRRCSEL